MVTLDEQQTVIDSLVTQTEEFEKQITTLKEENADYGEEFDKVITLKNDTILSLRKQLKAAEAKLDSSSKAPTATKKSAKTNSSNKRKK